MRIQESIGSYSLTASSLISYNVCHSVIGGREDKVLAIIYWIINAILNAVDQLSLKV